MERRLKDVECLYCWKTFRPKCAKRKYCSKECSQKGRTILRDHICEFCWRGFKSKKKVQKYCGIECQHQSYKKQKECTICWELFSPHYGSQEKCEKCIHRKGKIQDKVCEICWKVFHPKRNEARFCSNKCKNIAKITLADVICPICWKTFHQYDKNSKYCSKECFWKSDFWRTVPQKITKPNLNCKKYLESLWYNVEIEARIWEKSYDLKIWDVVIEINPFVYHNSTRFPYNKGNPKPANYHQIRMQYALDNWYKCIMVWDWTSYDEVVDMIEDKWFHYEWPPRRHRYNWKTKEHIIDNWLNKEDMLSKWFVEIYDCWEEIFTSNKNKNEQR